MADDEGATDGPEPMALLVATADRLHLTSTRGNFVLPCGSVVGLGRGNLYPWFFRAVRIHHTVPGVPGDLQFMPLRVKPAVVMGQLHALGYRVR